MCGLSNETSVISKKKDITMLERIKSFEQKRTVFACVCVCVMKIHDCSKSSLGFREARGIN